MARPVHQEWIRDSCSDRELRPTRQSPVHRHARCSAFPFLIPLPRRSLEELLEGPGPSLSLPGPALSLVRCPRFQRQPTFSRSAESARAAVPRCRFSSLPACVVYTIVHGLSKTGPAALDVLSTMRTHGPPCRDLAPSRCVSGRESAVAARHGSTTVPPPTPLATMKGRDPALPDMAAPGCDPTTDRIPIAIVPSSPRMRRPSSRCVLAAFLFVLAVLLPQPAHAARVTFDNCLSTNYKEHEPRRLQFEPLFVDAVFDTESDRHGLRVTAWGNVTGGEIERQPNPKSNTPKATTLIRKVNVLTYEPYRSPADFCNDALENAECPLTPVLDTTGM